MFKLKDLYTINRVMGQHIKTLVDPETREPLDGKWSEYEAIREVQWRLREFFEGTKIGSDTE